MQRNAFIIQTGRPVHLARHNQVPYIHVLLETNEPLALSYHVSNMAANSGWLELESDPGFNRFYPHPHVYIFHLQIPRMICAPFDNLMIAFSYVGLFSLLIEEFGEYVACMSTILYYKAY